MKKQKKPKKPRAVKKSKPKKAAPWRVSDPVWPLEPGQPEYD